MRPGNTILRFVFSVVLLCSYLLACSETPPISLPTGLSAEDATRLQQDMKALEAQLATLHVRKSRGTSLPIEDAELFYKGVVWALRYETSLSPGDFALVRRALERGKQRADALSAGKVSWAQKKGRLVRGYVSEVDGSVQPYGLVVPESYDPRVPMRLDVVLHGSTRPRGLSELAFLTPFDEGDEGGNRRGEGEKGRKGNPMTQLPNYPTTQLPNSGNRTNRERDYIELHPLGRVENCYRWAGETDVFEAIEDVCRKYNIARNRIVLRGMSMGASGTWHLGLKHPDFFVALGPYCGYVDTHRFSETPGMNFVKVGPLPEYQEMGLHLLDSVDYAANAGVVPAIAAIGEKDPFFQAHVIMGEAFRREGLAMTNLISPGTAHVQDPVTFAEQMRQIGAFADLGRNLTPRHLRFVTWTLKYSRCYWLEILGLEAHYRRAELNATVADDGTIHIAEPKNITRFAILAPILQGETPRLRIGDTEIHLPRRENIVQGVVIERRQGKWIYAGERAAARLSGKRPGLQGPIDDAFTSPFLCVRGTGQPWNPTVQAWADANLKRFAYEWNRYFRGELPVKDDTAVTEADCRRYNLILFGDPSSNLWIRRALPKLPLGWTRDELRLGTARTSAADHAPSLICPSPFGGTKGASPRYLVLNSGHTFHEAELNRLNYLLFPRLGDWAVMKVGATVPANPSEPLQEEVVQAGFFHEDWRLTAPESKP